MSSKMIPFHAFWAAVMCLSCTVASYSQEQTKPNNPAPDNNIVNATSASTNPTDEFEPVDDMHHFMEMISQPSYVRLKELFSAEPTNRRVWREIRSHAMILAESSALVADRMPNDLTSDQQKLWRDISRDVYLAGKDLYKSPGKFEEAKVHYLKLIDNCNRCHKEFDNGKHQLEK